MKIFTIILLLFSFQIWARYETNLKPFVTDYCTAYVEGTHDQPNLWKHCCEEHDLYFWAGGSLDDRKASDLRLKTCVEKTGATTQAILIYTAVSIGGSSPVRFKTKQWGHAWDGRQRYVSLTEDETSKIILHLDTNNQEMSPDLKQSLKEQLNSRLDSK